MKSSSFYREAKICYSTASVAQPDSTAPTALTSSNEYLPAFAKNAVKGVSVTLSGRNLFMFLPKTNEWTDPEFSNTTGNAQGVSGLDNTPPTRIFGASINIQL